jgi:hypothetical protein
MAEIDIDLEEFTKEQLIAIIIYAHAHDLTFNQAIVKAMTSYLEANKI